MSYYMFIDDERFPPDDGNFWVIARNKEEVSEILERKGSPSFISFDHDLGDKVPSGYDIAKLLIESDLENGDVVEGIRFTFGEDFGFYVHSQNPIGKENIKCIIENYLKIKNT